MGFSPGTSLQHELRLCSAECNTPVDYGCLSKYKQWHNEAMQYFLNTIDSEAFDA